MKLFDDEDCTAEQQTHAPPHVRCERCAVRMRYDTYECSVLCDWCEHMFERMVAV
jgi:hypothetical protein